MRFNHQTPFTLFLIISVLAWASHCILIDAYGSAENTNSKSSPCHSTEKKEGHHKKCQDTGCCQPAIKTSGQSLAHLDQFTSYSPFILTNVGTVFENTTDFSFVVPQHTTGPPKVFSSLVSSLSSAPQAPPL